MPTIANTGTAKNGLANLPQTGLTMSRRKWTAAEIRKLRSLYPRTENVAIGKCLGRTWSAIQNKATKLRLHKSPDFLSGPDGRFQSGMVPWNLGKTGYMGANRTSFRKGRKPQTWRPVGSERMDSDGQLWRKVADTRNKKRDWKPVKDLVWERWRGRIHRGQFVVHKDRDRQNFRLKNLVLVNRVENMKRNTYHRYPKEIARLIQLRGALNRQINKRERNAERH